MADSMSHTMRGCDGVVALVSKNTRNATGQLWEVSCAKGEAIPILGIYATSDNRPASFPKELDGVRVVAWTWPNIKGFLDRL